MKLLEDIKSSEINYLIIEYKERLARFGYRYIEEYCKSHNVEVIVLESQEEKGLNKEMVEDMISIITSFSARIYGKRGGKKVKETLFRLEKEGEGN
ncbi:recombinase family protein [Serpentinicella alkaliphila]|uniref:recombinase family protein n=1 Tax=Serpentinicella alkaliphila TaxID=1734049 RepID=UPI001FA9C06F|nr:recombinase family protein [Serpentinicella alkaliphila]